MMPNLTIYTRNEDAELLERARKQRKPGESFSHQLMLALRLLVEQREDDSWDLPTDEEDES